MAKGTKTAGPKARSRPKPVAASARIRAKIIALLVENPAMTAADVALELKISAQRVRAYMTRQLRAEVSRLREESRDPTLEDIDLAMRRQARLGNVQAARLVYMRMAQKGEALAVPTLEELEAELASLKQLEDKKGEMQDDTDRDAGVAVADDACG